ncbi:MAG TPA: site-specific integrase [Sideroxyarcus sp.]|nr:site-specific integrase [Sideroxyarcus sp.]
MASKRKRSNGSWEFVVKNKELLQKPVYLTFANEKEGDDYCANLEKLLASGIVPNEFAKPSSKAIATIKDAILEYIEAVHITDDDVIILGVMSRGQLGGVRLEKATYQWAEKWVKELQAEGIAPSTIRKRVGALARCFDWLIRRQDTMLAVNPLRMLPKRYATTADGRKDVERERRLHDGEEKRILSVLNREKPEDRERALALPEAEALRLMFTLALETAMRMREIYTLTSDQVSLEQRTIYLEKTKNGDKRQVPLSSVAHDALKAYITSEMVKLFPFWDGSLDPAKLRTTSNRISHQWSRVFSAAKCDGLHFHDLRHEATSRLFERTDFSDIEIAKITGHRNPKVLMRYANLRGSTLAARMW